MLLRLKYVIAVLKGNSNSADRIRFLNRPNFHLRLFEKRSHKAVESTIISTKSKERNTLLFIGLAIYLYVLLIIFPNYLREGATNQLVAVISLIISATSLIIAYIASRISFLRSAFIASEYKNQDVKNLVILVNSYHNELSFQTLREAKNIINRLEVSESQISNHDIDMFQEILISGLKDEETIHELQKRIVKIKESKNVQ